MTEGPDHETADVVVAGGGPAGASAAIMLATTGHRVLLLERGRFPRAHIGESLPPKIETLLAILGLAPAVAAAGFVRMAGTTVYQGAEVIAHDFDAEQKQLGYQVDRARFDLILLDRARALGVQVVEGATVVGPTRGPDGTIAGVRWRAESGEVRSAPARFVVDATGGRGVLSRMFGSRRREAIHTLALCAYFRDAAIPRSFPATNTLFEMLPDGWIWSVLLDDGRRNVTLGVDAASLKRSGRAAIDVYREAVASSHLVAPLVANATMLGEPGVHDATWFSSDVYAGDGFLLAGDAACFIDPLTSHGVYKAIHSGIGGAAVINTVLRRPERAALALRHHQEQQARAFARYSDIALTFYQASPYASLEFWAARTRRELEHGRAFSEAQLAEQRARRERFTEEARRLGGRGLGMRAKPELRLEQRTVAEANFIVERPVLVASGDPLFELAGEPLGVDVAKLFPLLDGRTLEAVFEAYVEASGEPRSSELAKKLTRAMNALIERGLLEGEPL